MAGWQTRPAKKPAFPLALLSFRPVNRFCTRDIGVKMRVSRNTGVLYHRDTGCADRLGDWGSGQAISNPPPGPWRAYIRTHDRTGNDTPRSRMTAVGTLIGDGWLLAMDSWAARKRHHEMLWWYSGHEQSINWVASAWSELGGRFDTPTTNNAAAAQNDWCRLPKRQSSEVETIDEIAFSGWGSVTS